ncbi:hypothetical protein N2152v2_006579 [Parachlorella kessleri]
MEYEINLEALIKMKRVFEEADEDGSGELDIEEFTQKLGPHLGRHLSEAQIAQLFLKIDADCGGTIDWNEFTNYFFLQRGVTNAGEDQQRFCLYPKGTWRKEWREQTHKDSVQRIQCCRRLEKYITCGKDGTFRLWHMKDLAPIQVVQNSSAWVNDAAYLEDQRKLLVASMDRAITWYDLVRHSFEYSGRLTLTGQLGAPQCLAVLDVGMPQPSIFYGDSTGAVIHLKCGLPEQHTARVLGSKDYDIVHQEHTDWVTQLLDIPEVGLLSSSLDSTVKVLDLARGAVANTFALHRKAVRSMAYSRAFSLVASAGPERSVLLWPPKGNINRKIGELVGHSAGVVQVVMADARSQAITLAEDHTIRVWDLRNHSCVQTINPSEWERGEDSRAEALFYDIRYNRLVTAGSSRPSWWDHRAVQSDKGHNGRLCSALYNSAFDVVVSGDQAGGILMWNAQNGQCEGGFSFNGGSSLKLTAMAFDANQRRLLTASETGELKIWNFNSGAVLRQYKHKEGRKEITAVAFLTPPQFEEACPNEDSGSVLGGSSRLEHEGLQQPAGTCPADDDDDDEGGPPGLVLATGWSRHVCIWEDSDERVISEYRRLQQHGADVLCMACLDGRVVATGDFEANVKVCDLRTGVCLANMSYDGQQWERAVDKLAFLPASVKSGGHPLLLGCGQDGLIKVWQLQLQVEEAVGSAPPRPSTTPAAPAAAAAAQAPGCEVHLVVELRATQRSQDCVTAVAVDAEGSRLITGDSSGHVRVWDVGCIDVAAGRQAAAASFKVLAMWRAREAAIVSAQHIPQRNLLLLASHDSTVSMWTLQGGLVGVFGQHSWSLDDPASWQDPSGTKQQAAPVQAGPTLTPREIIKLTPRRTHWEVEGSLSSAASSPRISARSVPWELQGSSSGVDTKGVQLPKMGLPPALQHLAGQQESDSRLKRASGSNCTDHNGEAAMRSPHTAAVTAAAVREKLIEAAQRGKAARDAWEIPLSVQAHTALQLHGMAEVPSEPADIWGSIKGYHGSGRHKLTTKKSKASSRAAYEQQANEVAAIMSKAAAAFGRKANSQNLSLKSE